MNKPSDLDTYEIEQTETIHSPMGYAFRVSEGECGIAVHYQEIDSDKWARMIELGGCDLALVLESMIRIALTTDDAEVVRFAVARACDGVEK